MDTLLAPLEELTSKDLFTQKVMDKIPIPNIDYLKEQTTALAKGRDGTSHKWDDIYVKFCHWAALPQDLRKPPTHKLFEQKNNLPTGYTQRFKERADFNDRRWAYFWDWLMDLYPDVVYGVYKRAVGKSDKAAGIFIDLLSKKMNLDKPKMTVAPMVLVGVSQERIDKLFTPKGYTDGIVIPEKMKR